MKTAEEILNKHCLNERSHWIGLTKEGSLKAMQEFAESYHAEKVAEVTDEEIEKWAIQDIPKCFNIKDQGPVINIAYHARITGAKWMRNRLMKP